MNTLAPNEHQIISAYIKRHEGTSAKPYIDTAGHLTVGVGHKVLPGENPNKVNVDKTFQDDVQKHIARAKGIFPKYDSYPLEVKKAIIDGVYRGEYAKGQKTVNYINTDQWDKVPGEYVNREDYRKSKDPRNKQGGVYKRMDENANIFRSHANNLSQAALEKESLRQLVRK